MIRPALSDRTARVWAVFAGSARGPAHKDLSLTQASVEIYLGILPARHRKMNLSRPRPTLPLSDSLHPRARAS